MLDEITLQKLGLIRYLYETAMEEALKPEPFGLISILKFHDSVELFLDLACDKFGIPANKTHRFKDYWTELEKHLSQPVSEKRSMERLNDARVSFKHHSNLPHATSIEKFRVNVTDFFEDNTPLIFGIEFNKVSLAYLIQNSRIRAYLDEANKLIEGGKRGEALTKIAIAFAQIMEDFTYSEKAMRYRELFFTKDPFPLYRSSSILNEDREFEQFIRSITASLDTLRQGMQVLSLGIEYPRYIKFRALTPFVTKMLGDTEYHLPLPTPYTQDTLPSIETCRFCQEFVIASALRIEQFSFEAGM